MSIIVDIKMFPFVYTFFGGIGTMDYDYRKMGRLIRKIRKEKGISQEVLSGFAGIGRSHLAMIETGGKNANMETLWKISEALDMPLSALLERYEKECVK